MTRPLHVAVRDPDREKRIQNVINCLLDIDEFSSTIHLLTRPSVNPRGDN
jgi:hypothetical protein